MSIVYIVSAPSGSGKSTLVNELFKRVRNLDFSISYTTRPPRGSEQNGKEYFFVSRQEFEAMIAADEFLEHATVFGNYYGTARRFLREAENRSNDLLLDIDVQGASKIKERIPEAVSIFILPPDRDKLEWRLRTRGLDSEEVIRRRLDTARREIENYSKYDYILVNNLIEQSADELKDIVLAERLIKNRGAELSEEEKRLVKTAQACQLEEARERVQPILASFNPQVGKGNMKFRGRVYEAD
jgi:guanylate kinase